MDAIIVSTETLKDQIIKKFPTKKVFINSNALGDDILYFSNKARTEIPMYGKFKNMILIGYASGSNTHRYDFKEASSAILKIMKKYDNVYLAIIGDLPITKDFENFKNRVFRVPLQPWRLLPYWIARFDINIAPLEKNNIFCDAKSALKYFEAGIVGIPTIGSKRSDFIKAIRNGDNGFLADTESQWFNTMELLVKNKELRKEIGENAYKDVIKNYITAKRANNLSLILNEIKQQFPIVKINSDKFIVNWILQSPIKGSGGYTTIFRLINLLPNFHHNIYIDRVHHLKNKSLKSVKKYIREGWGTVNCDIYLIEQGFLDSDFTIATAWATSYRLQYINNTNRKVYFIQDLEYNFFDKKDGNYRLAKESYTLNVYNVVLGDYIKKTLSKIYYKYIFDSIPFGVDNKTYFYIDNLEKEYDVIFYARPETPRRGFELGIEGLSLLYKKNKNIKIALYGSKDLSAYNIPFTYKNLGILKPKDLNIAFNKSKIGISFSKTNISLIPFEMMLCKIPVIELDNKSTNTFFKKDENIILIKENIYNLITSIEKLLRDKKLYKNIQTNGYLYANTLNWENTAKKLEEKLLSNYLVERVDKHET